MNFTIKDVFIPWEDGYASIDVQVVNTKIAAMGADLDVIGTEIAGKNKLLLPGFFNAHTHSSEMWQRGVVSMLPLELWLAELYDFAPLDVEKVYLSALATAVETLLSGGTSVVDHLVLIPGEELATIGAAVRAYREVGIRALIAPLIQDEPLKAGIPLGRLLQGEAPCLRSTAETLAIIEQAVRDFHCPDEGVTMLVAPTGIQLCSDALFIGCVELSDKYDLCRHSHLLETQAQAMVALEKHGCTAVEHLQRLGYLGDRTSLAHCIWLTDNDITILAASQSSVVHNPLSNLRLGSGIAPIFKYLKAGVNIALGCDGASSNDSQDLLEAIKIGSILHNVTASEYRSWITPRQSVNMAAFGGAKAFKLADKLGSLAPGKVADLVLYDMSNLSLLPRTDPIGLLVLGRPTNVVDSVWVNGNLIVHEGQVMTVDIYQLRQELFNRSEWEVRGKSATVAEMEGHYRRVMGV